MEIARGIGALWRNAIQVRTHFDQSVIKFDAYDRSPMNSRMHDGKLVAPLGAGRVGAIENSAAHWQRFTVALLSNCDGIQKSPDVLMKGVGPARTEGSDLERVPTNLDLRFAPDAT